MWMLFAFGALFFQALQNVIDKIAIVKDKNIDSLSATFWRTFMFFMWCLILGLTGVLGELKIFIPFPLFVFALLYMGSAFFYTHLLKKIEISGSSVLSYASPFFYLIIDTILLKTGMSTLQVLGVILLAAGGISFALQPGKLKFREEFTPKIWLIFLYNLILGIIEFYSFKYYFQLGSLNEISFYTNAWLVMTLGFAIIISFQGKWKIIASAAKKNNYLQKTILSKGIDAVGSWFWLHAVSMVAVSRVDAIGSFFPLILLGVVYLMQNIFSFKADEELSKNNFLYKLVAIILLCIGGFLAK